MTTGGADPANATPGVQLNFVLRSGTNTWRASSRFYFENDDLQSDNVGDLRGVINSYNRVGEYMDWGVEGGGPLMRNRLFAWGAYGKTEPEIRVFNFDAVADDYLQVARDATTLENISAKVTGEISHEGARPLHVLPGEQDQVRPRRVGPAPGRDDAQPGRADEPVQR